ncbi:peptidylprolyl isomerase [Zooshikella marina]|uniref:peptidylprolyl isomerase n=1 Tax=Zooshikella ganghwensis TaxID=202772 RepID=UPI001BB0855A|nr:peptidylprolyl isomerase [Zooshikella ganghwensis]MBU2706936.1 peptidylprolyl isomerase [Zooshikella ganghwensis]
MKYRNGMLSVLIISAVIAGCSRDEKKEVVSDNSTLAKVNDKIITKDAFNAYLQFKRIPSDNTDLKSRALAQYLEREALANVIEKQSLVTQQQIDTEINEFKKQMLISRYFDQYLQNQITDEAVADYYAKNQQQYSAEKVHVAHILIRTKPSMTEAERQAKLNQAQELYSKIQADADFNETAKQYSEDKLSATKGGDLGWLPKGAIAPTFSTTAFAMAQGEVSTPVATPYGFHIIKVVEPAKTIQQPLEKVRGDIRYILRQQARKAELDRLLQLAKIKRLQEP